MEVSKLQERVDALEKELDVSTRRATQLETDNTALTSQQADWSHRESELTEKLSTSTKTITHLQTKLHELESKLPEAQSESEGPEGAAFLGAAPTAQTPRNRGDERPPLGAQAGDAEKVAGDIFAPPGDGDDAVERGSGFRRSSVSSVQKLTTYLRGSQKTERAGSKGWVDHDKLVQMVEDADTDGDGRFSGQEVLALLKQVLYDQTEKFQMSKTIKYQFRKIVCLVLVCGLLLLSNFGLTMTSSVIGGNLIKESHVNEQRQLTDVSGKAVSTEVVRSYAGLLDLPRFDLQTLQQLRMLVVRLEHGDHASYQVSSVTKKSLSVVVFGIPDGWIRIDSLASQALAKIRGELFQVTGVARRERRRRLSGAPEEPAKLYTETDFFTAENGFIEAADGNVLRRLTSDAEMVGWATFAVAVAEAVAEQVQAMPDPARLHFWVRGTMYIQDAGNSSDEEEVEVAATEVKLWFLYNMTTSQTISTRFLLDGHTATADHLDNLIDYTKSYHFDFKTVSGTRALNRCSPIALNESAAEANVTQLVLPMDNSTEDSTENLTSLFLGQTLFQMSDETGVHTFMVDPDMPVKDSAIPAVLVTPDPEQCRAAMSGPATRRNFSLNASAAGNNVSLANLSGDGGRRLWNNNNRETSYNLWRVASAAYDGATNFNGGWTAWAACMVDYKSESFLGSWDMGQARAQFFYKGGQMVLAFAGSDDVMDWLHNFNAIPGGPSGKYHRGFYNYQNDLQPCVNKYRNMLKGWGIETDYIVGHSLGGAAATIYAQEHGQPVKGVATYGAPKTNQFYAGSWFQSRVNGWRFQHSDDPVPSSMCFLGCALITHKHMISNGYEVYDKLVCGSSRVTDRRKRCQKKWWKFWCWFEVFYYWVRSCGWHKRLYKLWTPGFAHPYSSLIWGAYGAIAKHGAYGDYPSITV